MPRISKNKKGFTLIELLVVVAIISLLSSVVLAALNSARLKGRDASLRQEAVQFRTLLEQEFTDTGSYLGLNPNTGSWINTAADCTAAPFTGSYAAQAKAICTQIVQNASPTATFKFYPGVSGTPPNQYSLLIALASKNTYLCVGSSGRTSDTDAGTTWLSPGCYFNP